MEQTCKVANPARGQLEQGNMNISLSSFTPENLVARETGSVKEV